MIKEVRCSDTPVTTYVEFSLPSKPQMSCLATSERRTENRLTVIGLLSRINRCLHYHHPFTER